MFACDSDSLAFIHQKKNRKNDKNKRNKKRNKYMWRCSAYSAYAMYVFVQSRTYASKPNMCVCVRVRLATCFAHSLPFIVSRRKKACRNSDDWCVCFDCAADCGRDGVSLPWRDDAIHRTIRTHWHKMMTLLCNHVAFSFTQTLLHQRANRRSDQVSRYVDRERRTFFQRIA